MIITLPRVLAIDELVNRNPVRQIGLGARPIDATITPYTRGKLKAHLLQEVGTAEEILIVPDEKRVSVQDQRVILRRAEGTIPADLEAEQWARHPLHRKAPIDFGAVARGVAASWEGAFSYVREDPVRGTGGLRNPQIGALHAIQAHWSTSDATATIVMPTGTGKTDTMIALLVSTPCPKVLVIVPTDALRTQIAEKFLTLGVLRDVGSPLLADSALYPVVGQLLHIPRTPEDVDAVFDRCQVVVTTSSVAGQCGEAVQDRMVHHCPYLFIDEAHHAEAPTWSAFKSRFKDGRILQFTATPFREDGRLLDGTIAYKYPLRRAQEENYFRPIRFVPVVEFNPRKSDEAIASTAVEQLRREYDKGQILMARVADLDRAKQVFKVYQQYPEFHPIELHTGLKLRDRVENRRRLLSGEARIVVCVDMLGEGFDLPELKIAAFHDIRKTLAVTLQLAGRFVRAKAGVGDPTFIANVAEVDVQDELRKLYTRDPDWNALLPELSEKMIGEQVSLQDFLKGFTDLPDEISLKAVQPATSAVVYRTRCSDWAPEAFRTGIPGIAGCEQVHYAVNEAEKTLVVVTARRTALPWTDVDSLFSWEWTLYVVFWSQEQALLFVNTSANAGDYRALAQAIAGDDASIIRGQQVFRAFAGVNRLRLQNVGLTEKLGRNIRYTGRMGADVESALTEVQRRKAQKSVLAGSGFADGQRVTVGASRKGRVWSIRRETLDQLVSWCVETGAKLLDDSINPDDVLKGTLEETPVISRPPIMPTVIDWPEEIYKAPEASWWIEFGGRVWQLAELSIDLVAPDTDSPLRFSISSGTAAVEIELQLEQKDESPDYRFVTQGEARAQVRRGEEATPEDLDEFLYEHPPVIWFVDGSSLEGNQHVRLRVQQPPYPSEKISAWDWTGVNLRTESQGPEKDAFSIQARVIRELKKSNYAVVFDDDDKGELADVVAVRLVGDQTAPTAIDVELYHCKYSGAANAGHRIGDLYVVCGQAQKCISWMRSPDRQTEMFTHMLRRETLRRDAGLPSRIELGTFDAIVTLREMSRLRPINVRVFIVQPGLSKASASRDQLELLSVTENHLMETYQLPFGVIASP